jgi:hypothetical protein
MSYDLRFSLSVAAALVLAPVTARAENREAEGLFQAAKASMARGDTAKACEQFGASLRLEPATGTLLNLADCEEKRGHLGVALQLFRDAQSRLPRDDFRVAFAAERVAALAARIPELTVALRKDAPSAARVFLDGTQLSPSELGRPVPIDPGTHAVLVRAPGRADQRSELSMHDAERRVVEVDAGPPLDHATDAPPAGTSPNGPPPPEAGPGSARRTTAYLLGGVGAVGVVAGAVTGIMTMSAASTYSAHCNAGQCDPQGLDAASTGRVVQIVSPIAFAVGVLGLGAGTYLLLTSRAAERPVIAVQPVAVPSGAGASLAGTF